MSLSRFWLGIALAILCSSILAAGLVRFFRVKWTDQASVPPYGGLAVFVSVWLVFFGMFPELVFRSEQWHIFLSSCVILLTGLLDDRYDLSPLQKSVGIVLAANYLYFQAGVQFNLSFLPDLPTGLAHILTYILTMVWLYFVTNAVNFMDGLDGLASSVSLVSLLSLAIIAYLFSQTIRLTFITLLLLLAAAILGFLPFNWHPAKLYLGDTGSLFIGFMYAVLTVSNLKNASFFSLIIPIIIYALPLFDTVYATIRRFLTGQSVTRKDREHLHHRLMRQGYSHSQVVIIMTSITMLFSCLAIVVQFFPAYRFLLMLLALGILCLLLHLIHRLRH